MPVDWNRALQIGKMNLAGLFQISKAGLGYNSNEKQAE